MSRWELSVGVYIDVDADDCCQQSGTAVLRVVRGDQARDPRAVADFERGVLVQLHDDVVDAGCKVLHVATLRFYFRLDADGGPIQVRPGEPCDGVSCEISVCFQ